MLSRRMWRAQPGGGRHSADPGGVAAAAACPARAADPGDGPLICDGCCRSAAGAWMLPGYVYSCYGSLGPSLGRRRRAISGH